MSLVDQGANPHAHIALYKRKFSADERDVAAESGAALPDGSFPIKNKGDLKNAISAYGRAKNKAAAKKKVRARVFCASMADVFEDHADVVEARKRLWGVIAETPWLNWQLLTKRPENIARFVPWGDSPPDNVWLGTTVENQECADERIPLLLQNKAVVRFLSCEPLLGLIGLKAWLGKDKVNWLITGGETGRGARPMPTEWVRHLRDQCASAGVPHFFKQQGDWAEDSAESPHHVDKREFVDLQGRRFVHLGNKYTGRLLDGREWNEFPVTGEVA